MSIPRANLYYQIPLVTIGIFSLSIYETEESFIKLLDFIIVNIFNSVIFKQQIEIIQDYSFIPYLIMFM